MKKQLMIGAAALTLAAGLMTGCTLDQPQGKVLSVTTRGLYVAVSATDSQTGTPSVKLGLGSQTVAIIPTSNSNQVYAANFADSSTVDQTVNPFSTSGSEAMAAGSYQVGQTNSASITQPVVPK